MIKNLTIFHNEKELEELTGLTNEELWDKGFTLEDWNGGIRVKISERLVPMFNNFDDDIEGTSSKDFYKYKEAPIQDEDIDNTLDQLIENAMSNFCVGYEVVILDDYMYYIIHHS